MQQAKDLLTKLKWYQRSVGFSDITLKDIYEQVNKEILEEDSTVHTETLNTEKREPSNPIKMQNTENWHVIHTSNTHTHTHTHTHTQQNVIPRRQNKSRVSKENYDLKKTYINLPHEKKPR